MLLQHSLWRLLSRGLQLQLWGCCPGGPHRCLLGLKAWRSNLLRQLLGMHRHGRRLLLLDSLLRYCLHGLLCSRRSLSRHLVLTSSPLQSPEAASSGCLLLATPLLLLPRGQHSGRSRVLLLLGRLQQGSPPTLDLASTLCCLALLLLL